MGTLLRLFPAAIILLTLLPFLAFAAQGLKAVSPSVLGPGTWLSEHLFTSTLRSALSFSLLQAGASTVLAVLIGLPGAYIVAKYRFPGRKLLFSLSAVPFCLPPLLVILSFILYYGRTGWISKLIALLGFQRSGYSGFLYSFWGLVFVHAFYNFPIVIQNLGSLWARMPRSREEAARTLGAGKIRAFAAGTLPFLLPSLLQSASLIFLFCFFSFTIVLVFGGLSGSTLEVGIYRAIRFTNDKPQALLLALVQTSTALAVVAVFAYFDSRSTYAAKGFGAAPPLGKPGRAAKSLILVYGLLLAIFFLGPLAALAAEAFTVRSSLAGNAVFGLDNFRRIFASPGSPLLSATFNSLALSGSAALFATLIGLLLGLSLKSFSSNPKTGRRRRLSPGMAAVVMSLPLALSPAVVASGWSALFSHGGSLLVVAGQIAMAWPFVARSLRAAFAALDTSKREAALVLGAKPVQAAFLVDLPAILPSILGAAAFAFSMTMGDANIPLMLGGGGSETLPLLLYRLSSSYRYGEACAVGLVLAAFTSLAFFLKGKNDELS
ncbi:MAG: iron ABC transporter permease [Spirochaetes bacterium]|nr:iron ABC transporter permease [Spirochaetota bacterium]